jgi:hypothetical protein
MEHQMKNMHILEFFRNDDWRVRVAVLIGQWAFLLVLTAILVWGSDKLLAGPLLAIILKKFT